MSNPFVTNIAAKLNLPAQPQNRPGGERSGDSKARKLLGEFSVAHNNTAYEGAIQSKGFGNNSGGFLG